MCRKDKQKQIIAALSLNIVTLMMFTLPRADLAAASLSDWGFNVLALVQLVIILLLVIRFFKQKRFSQS